MLQVEAALKRHCILLCQVEFGECNERMAARHEDNKAKASG